mgnify:CR=1 FL=1
MRTKATPWICATIAASLSVAFVLAFRLPLPFEGFSAVTAAILAGMFTTALGLFMPPHWVWTDSERLHHAFRSRHNISDGRAASVLDAITTAHRRASILRVSSDDFAEDLKAQTEQAADALDAAAREIFYDPAALDAHRSILIRADLIEETVLAHARLRHGKRSKGIEAQLDQSRNKVAAALASLETALAEARENAADRILTEVSVSSATAETLLAPRQKNMSSRRVDKEMR